MSPTSLLRDSVVLIGPKLTSPGFLAKVRTGHSSTLSSNLIPKKEWLNLTKGINRVSPRVIGSGSSSGLPTKETEELKSRPGSSFNRRVWNLRLGGLLESTGPHLDIRLQSLFCLLMRGSQRAGISRSCRVNCWVFFPYPWAARSILFLYHMSSTSYSSRLFILVMELWCPTLAGILWHIHLCLNEQFRCFFWPHLANL